MADGIFDKISSIFCASFFQNILAVGFDGSFAVEKLVSYLGICVTFGNQC